MTERTASRVAWITFGIIAIGFVVGFAYGLLNGLEFDLFVATMFLFPIVGALITTRQPRNIIGWMLLAVGLVWMLVVVTGVLLEEWKGLRGQVLALSSWLWIPGMGRL